MLPLFFVYFAEYFINQGLVSAVCLLFVAYCLVIVLHNLPVVCYRIFSAEYKKKTTKKQKNKKTKRKKKTKQNKTKQKFILERTVVT